MRSSALAYASISRQVNALEVIVRSNPVIRPLLDRLDDLQLQAWYVGAGAIAQTISNHLHGFPATHDINDYDIV